VNAYVRGKYQIAAYDPARNATGRRLAAFEARDAYGDAILAEVEEWGSAGLLGEPGAVEAALRAQRQRLGLGVQRIASRLSLSEKEVLRAESNARDIPIHTLERIAFVLGLDERYLAVDQGAGSDSDLGVRLRILTQPSDDDTVRLSPAAVLAFAEAASITRVQSRIQYWLGESDGSNLFEPSGDYGDAARPAWRVGYDLAERTRDVLELGNTPINSMRELVEGRLNIPVIQLELPTQIAGATISTGGDRGIILNVRGQNQNVWVRRATLAHELCHLLYDPVERLQSVRVDTYHELERNPQEMFRTEFVEQRANSFAISLLAPPMEVRRRVSTPILASEISGIMTYYGIGRVAARYHVENAHYRNWSAPQPEPASPSPEQVAAENFTIDYFPIRSTPIQRSGRFAFLIAAAAREGIISSDTAAIYLDCSEQEFEASKSMLLELGPAS